MVEAVGFGDEAAVAVMVQLPVDVNVTAPEDELTAHAPAAE